MITKTVYGYTITKEDIYLDIVFYEDNIVRFVYSKNEKLPDSTEAIITKPKQVKVELEKNEIRTESLRIVVNENTLNIEIFDKSNNLLNRDIKVDLNKIELEKRILWESSFYDLSKNNYINVGNDINKNKLIDDINNNELVPFYLGLDNNKVYGIYFDNDKKPQFDINDDNIKIFAEEGNIDYFFFYDEEINGILNGYKSITGKSLKV